MLARALANAGRPMPVAADVFAALQASRWFEADTAPFGSDLAEIVAKTTLAPDALTQLLASAAALVPVLVAPETNLRGWLDQSAAAPLAGLVGAVTRFADRGQRLDHRWLDGVVDASEQKRQVERLQGSAKRILDEAMHWRTKYQAATNVWREFFRRRLRPVLDRIIRSDETVVTDAEELVRRLGATATLTKELNTLDRQLRPGIGEEIDYGARDQLHAHVRDVLDAIDAWARQTRTVLQVRDMDWFPGQVAELRSSVGQMIGDAMRHADELVSSGSGALAACGSALRRSLADLAALLRIEGHARPPATIPELREMARDASGLDEAIANRWLWCPGLPTTGAADERARAPERLCDALFSVPPTLAACRGWIDRERYDEASRLAAFADGARETLNSALERSRILLRDERDALRIGIEQGVLDGYVGEERARLLGTIERIDPPTATNIEQARRELHRVRDEIDAARRKGLDAALVRCERLVEEMRTKGVDPGLIASRRADLLAKHAQGDIRVVDETLALWGQDDGEDRHTRFDAVQAGSLRAFRETFLPAAEPMLQQRGGGWGALRQALNSNKLAIAGRAFPVGQKLNPVIAALEAWYALKRDGADAADTSVTSRVRALLLFVGFLPNGDSVDKPLERKRPGVRQVLGRYGDAGFSPVPQFGSQARHELKIVCVWERPGADTLKSIFAELPALGPPVVVFYLGRLNDAQRMRLRALGRERPSVLVLDEMLLLFLAGERDARLPVFFACTLPYTWVNPYTPFQAGEVPPEMYFGRRALVLELQRPEGSCIVYGGRQLGKSALLREVARQFHDPLRKQFAVVIDVLGVGDAAHGREATVLWSLLRDRLKEVGAFETRRTSPEEIAKALREAFAQDAKLRVLVLLDEADQLLDADARDRFAIVNELRRLMLETGRRFKVVLAGLHNVQRFQQIPNQPLAHFGRAIQVGPLEPRDAADLVRKPLASLGFEFDSDSDVLRILSYTNYHPGLVQLFCHDLLIHLLSSTTVAPPVRVSRQSVDHVYQRAEVRKGIRDRFDWTLALDPRYQAIAWAIIVEQAENPQQPETFTVRKLQTLAQSWWPAGFSATREDEFRGLLDEMCGLGVLAGGIEQGFRLRSPNVVRLMGDVESRLIELGHRPAPGVFDTEQLHREYADHAYAPLTLVQERQLLARRWGVALVFGTRALGCDTFVPSLEALHNEASADTILVEHAPADVDATGLVEWFQNRRTLATGMRIFVLNAPAHAERAASLIEAARKYAERREQAVNVVGRVIVLFDGAATAAWVLGPGHGTIEGRLDAVLWLHKWTTAGIRPRLERHQLLGGPEQTNEVLRATAGWGQILNWVFNHGGAGIPQPEHDAFLAELMVRMAQPDSTERRALLEALELEKGTRSWELLRLLHLLGGTGVARVDLTPELFDTDLPGLLPEELDHILAHLVRIGVVELRLEPGAGAPGAGLRRSTVVVDPLVGAALFG